MNVADELRKLHELHASGALSDEEFAAAKARLLRDQPPIGLSPVGPTEGVQPQGDRKANQWAMFIHLSQYAGFVVPFAGLLLPIILWQVKKAEFPTVDAHGRVVVNWIISEIIYLVAFVILSLAFIGIPFLIATIVAGLVFPAIGGIKANDGEVWKYPLSIPFFR